MKDDPTPATASDPLRPLRGKLPCGWECWVGVSGISSHRREPCFCYLPGSCVGRYHTDRQRGAALQNTARCAAPLQTCRSRGHRADRRGAPLAAARCLSGHTVSPSNSQEECVTRRSVLAVPWRRCYRWIANVRPKRLLVPAAWDRGHLFARGSTPCAKTTACWRRQAPCLP